MTIRKSLCLSVLMLAAAMSSARAEDTPEKAALPKVLLIGDSISGGYHKAVIAALAGKADVTKNAGNAEYTGTGIKRLDEWLGDTKWDVIHFNWGLWDIYGWQYAKEDRSPEMYEKRLDALVLRMKQTGAKLIWATTTPCPPNAEGTMLKRFKTEVVISAEQENQYREAALRVMKKYDVQVDDLYALMKPRLSEFQATDNVHFSGAGYQLMAKQVVESITQALNGQKP